MPRVDLRPENPPFGYNAHEVPLVDVDFGAFDFDQHRLDNPRNPETLVDVFAHPKHFPLVIRKHTFDLEEASTDECLRAHLRYGEAEHARLGDTGISVAPTRHLEATLPVLEAGTEGWLFSLSQRLPLGYEPLNARREDHIAGNLFVLQGLTKYAQDTLTRKPGTYARFLSDIFETKQYSTLGEVSAIPVLHDTDPLLDDTFENGQPSIIFRRAVGELTRYAEEVMAAAHNDPAAKREANEILRTIQTELPSPYYYF